MVPLSTAGTKVVEEALFIQTPIAGARHDSQVVFPVPFRYIPKLLREQDAADVRVAVMQYKGGNTVRVIGCEADGRMAKDAGRAKCGLLATDRIENSLEVLLERGSVGCLGNITL